MRRLVFAVVCAAVLAAIAVPASADGRVRGAQWTAVSTFEGGVRVEAGRQADVVAGSGSDRDGRRCRLVPYVRNTGFDVRLFFGGSPGPEAKPFLEFCDGSMSRFRWITPDAPELAVRGEAERLARDVLKPGLVVGMNPPGRGLVGFPSWFWVE
ncbi:MAG: hypothetical protein AB7L84_09275, partial [Acidimicrobiia bacterium]